MSDNDINYSGKPKPYQPVIGSNTTRPYPVRNAAYLGYHNLDNLKDLLDELQTKTSSLISKIETELSNFNLKIQDPKLNTAHVIEWPSFLGTPKDYISYAEYKSLESKNSANAEYIRKTYENALRGPSGNTAIDILKMCKIFKIEANNIGEFLDDALGQIDDTAEFRTLELLQDWTENALNSTETITNFFETRAQTGKLPAAELDQVTSQRAAEYQALFQVKVNSINKDIVQNLNEVEKNFVNFSSIFYKKNLGPALKFHLNATRKISDTMDTGILANEARLASGTLHGSYNSVLGDQLIRNLGFEQKVDDLQTQIRARDTYNGYIKELAAVGKQLKPNFTDVELTDEEVEYYENPPQTTESDTSSLFFGMPSDSYPGDVASEGTATSLSRSDHRHGRETSGAGGGSSRTSTIVVAANNTSEAGKSGADFVCEGTNDHEVINEAFASNSLHGKVLFLEGDYYCSDIIEQNGVVEGVSPIWSTIHFENIGDYWHAPSVSDLIRSIGFQGAPSGGQTRVVLLGSQVDVENVWVYGNMAGVGIELGGGNFCTVRNSYVVQAYEGISLTNSAESEVRECLLEQCSWGVISDSFRARIIGNRMRDMTTAMGTGAGVQLNVGATESEVLNNYIAGAGDGIYVAASSLYRIVGNKIWGAQFYGLNIDGDEVQLHNNYVEGASLAGNNTYDAIHIGGDRCSVQGNRCHYNGFSNRPKYGIHDVGTSNLVINNDLRSSGVTASALLSGSTIKNLDGSANNWNLLV